MPGSSTKLLSGLTSPFTVAPDEGRPMPPTAWTLPLMTVPVLSVMARLPGLSETRSAGRLALLLLGWRLITSDPFEDDGPVAPTARLLSRFCRRHSTLLLLPAQVPRPISCALQAGIDRPTPGTAT